MSSLYEEEEEGSIVPVARGTALAVRGHVLHRLVLGVLANLLRVLAVLLPPNTVVQNVTTLARSLVELAARRSAALQRSGLSEVGALHGTGSHGPLAAQPALGLLAPALAPTVNVDAEVANRRSSRGGRGPVTAPSRSALARASK